MKVKKYITLLLLFAITIASNAQTWVAIDSTYNVAQKPTIEVLVSDATQYKFRITIHGYYKNTILENNTQYEQIDITGWHTLNNVGEPALPTFTQFVGLPANNECSVTISETEWTTLPAGKIYPAQEPREESDTTEFLFTINDSVYNVVEYQTDRYIVGEKACVSGMYGVPLSVLPIKYYPIQGEIDILKSCVVTVDFSSSSIVNGNLSIKNAKLLKNVVDNYNEALANTYNIPAADSINTNIYDYLIITADKYKNSDALKEFCTWKRIKGHNCKIVSCSEIGGNRPDSIKACVKHWYEKGVEYVLFVGTHNEIPCKFWKYNKGTREYKYSDYWYACLTSDYLADLAVGRFCANDSIELFNMISKTIAYENLTSKDTWVTKNLLVAHKEKAPEKYQQCCEEIRTAEYAKMPNFTTAYGAHDSVGGNNATNDMVVALINEGFGIVNYRGHGTLNSWKKLWNNEGKAFDTLNIEKITTKLYPLIFSIACETGDITRLRSGSCLLQHFMKSKYSAVAFLGSTNFINTDAASTLNKHLYTMLYNNSIYKFAYLNNTAQIKHILTYPYEEDSMSYAISNAISFICGGDPSLEIWTDTISRFSNLNLSYKDGYLNINTKSIKDYTITLFSPIDSSYFIRKIVESDSATIPNVPQIFILSLNKHNYMPLIYYVSNGDIYLQNENYALVRKIVGNNVYVGSDITNTKPQGNVVVKSGARLNIKSSGKTLLKKEILVEQGSVLYISKE